MKTIKNRIMNIKEKLTSIHLWVIFLSTTLIISSIAIYQYNRAEKYYSKLKNNYISSAYDLYACVEGIEHNFTKGLMTTELSQFLKIADEIQNDTNHAISVLNYLPAYGELTTKISKFLAQSGDYTTSLSAQFSNGEKITDKEYETIENMAVCAKDLKNSLLSFERHLLSGKLNIDNITDMTSDKFEKENPLFVSAAKETESNFEKIPSLVYDGPFSDHIENHSPSLLENKTDITKEEAQNKVKNLVGKKFSGKIEYLGENGGTLPTYSFSVKQNSNNNRTITVDITKKGGAISWFLDSRSSNETKLSVEDAIKNAKTFLTRYNFGNPKNNYYEVSGNTVLINFASTDNGIILYPDLIKVKVSLDNGEILGLECSGFISNHKKRNLPEFKFSDDEIKNKISPKASVSKINRTLIPTPSGGEVFCYEILCSYKDTQFLIYLNAETLKQENILMLQTSENGSLAI